MLVRPFVAGAAALSVLLSALPAAGVAAAASGPTVAEGDRFALEPFRPNAVPTGTRSLDYVDVELSADGQTAVFATEQPWGAGAEPLEDHLEPGVWVWRPATGEQERAGVVEGHSVLRSTEPGLSANGRYVAFVATVAVAAAEDVPTGEVTASAEGDPTMTLEQWVVVRDLLEGATRKVALLAQSEGGPDAHFVDEHHPDVSDDGTVVVWREPLPTGGSNSQPKVAVREGEGSYSVRDAGPAGTGSFGYPVALSGDGSRLAFWSHQDEVGWQLYTGDPRGQVLPLPGVVHPYEPAVQDSYAQSSADRVPPSPALDGDGGSIAFLAPGRDDHAPEVIAVHDVATATTRVPQAFVDGSSTFPAASRSPLGTAQYHGLRHLSLSGDGRWLSFSSIYTMGEGFPEQAWRLRLDGDAPAELVTHAADGSPAIGDTATYTPSLSQAVVADDGVVVVSSSARNLGEDADSLHDLFSTGATTTGPDAWPATAALKASPLQDSTVTLTWPEVADAAGYRVYENGATLADTTTTSRSVTVPAAGYSTTFSVRARYQGGVLSSDALRLTWPTGDTSGGSPQCTGDSGAPPTWPVGAALQTEAASRSVNIEWPPAVDDCISSYRVRVGDHEHFAGGSATGITVDGLAPDTDYPVTVEAGDVAGTSGGWSVPLTTTVTTVFDEATAVGLTTTPRPGGAVDLRWDEAAPSAATQVVLRAQGDGDFEELAEVVPGARTYVDRTIAPSTGYRYRVDRVVGEATKRWTAITSVTTLAPAVTSFSWSAPSHTAVAIGDQLTFTVAGDSGSVVTVIPTARTWDNEVLGDAAALPAVRLEESQTTPGTYTGTWTVTEGTAELTRLTASLTRGQSAAEKVIDGASAPGEVQGAVLVRVPGAWEQLDGAVVQLRSSRTWDNEQLVLGTGPERSVRFRSVDPGPDYRTTVGRSTWEMPYAAREGLAVAPGRTLVVDLDAKIPASLRVFVTDADGQAQPVDGITAVAPDGSLLGSWRPGRWPPTAFLAGLSAGQEMTVTAHLPSTLATTRTVSKGVTLQPGDNELPLLVTPLTRKALTVTVLRPTTEAPDGEPAASAPVTVQQTVDGRPWHFSGTTGEDGTVVLDVLAGAATVRARAWGHNEQSVEVSAAEGSATVRMYAPRSLPVRFTLVTKEAGEEPVVQPVAVDRETGRLPRWSVPVRVVAGVGAWSVTQVQSSPATVRAEVGDTVTFCATGPAGFDRQCEEVPVTPETDEVSADFVLEQYGAVQGRLVGKDGAPWRGEWSASLTPTAHGGRAFHFSGGGDRMLLPTAAGGDYRLRVWGYDGQGTRYSAPRTVTVPRDDVAPLGDVQMGDGGALLFTSTSVRLSTPEAVPGSTVEVRAEWDMGDWYWQDTSDPSLRVHAPAGTRLVPGSVTVDGQERTIGDDGQVQGHELSRTGSLRYRLELVRGTAGAAIDVAPSMAFTWNGRDWDATLGVASLSTPGVTLAAPGRTGLDTVPVSGRAPAGAAVRVFAAGSLVGSTTASEFGFWRTKVDLPYGGPVFHHTLHATTDQGWQELRSADVPVTYDRTSTVLDKVIVRQEGRARHEVDPAQGLARFNFSFAPYLPLIVELGFTTPDLVAKAWVKVGDEPAVKATYDRARKLWVAEAPSKGQGEIRVGWEVAPQDFFEPQPVPDRDEARSALPGEFASSTVEVEVDEGAQTITGAVDLPQDATADISFEVEDSSITRSGAPPGSRLGPVDVEYDDTSVTVTSDVTVTTTKAEMLSASSPAQAVALRAFSAASADVAATALDWGLPTRAELAAMDDASRLTTKIKVVEKFANIGFGFWNLWSGVKSRNADLDKLLARAAYCGDKEGERLMNEVQTLRAFGFVADTGSAILGLAMGEFTGVGKSKDVFDKIPGIDTKLTGVGMGIDAAVGSQFDGAYKALEASIKTNPQCPPPPPGADLDLDGKPDDDGGDGDGGGGGGTGVAAPYWLHDPSGNVFEGTADNPVEGVTATLMFKDPVDGWRVWNAEDYGQHNPQTTDAVGHYGWDVPEGRWQVVWTKEGYETARSTVLTVLPPHFDVHVGLVRSAAPVAPQMAAGPDGSVTVTFDRPVLVDSVTGRVAVTAGGAPVDGSTSAVAPQLVPSTDKAEKAPAFPGQQLAKVFRFTPEKALGGGTALAVSLAPGAADYAGRSLATAVQVDLRVPDAGGPGGTGGGGGGGGGGAAPAPAPSVTCPAGPGVPFADIAADNVHRAAIGCAAHRGLARGTSADRFDPVAPVTRGQMASFLTRLLREAGVALPAPSAGFPDVAAGGTHSEAVRQLATLGVTRGTADGTYRPEQPVTREQMASFLVRTWAAATGEVAPSGRDAFRDDDGSAHEAAIDSAAALGIARGRTSTLFDPLGLVQRDQMASFLVRLLETVESDG